MLEEENFKSVIKRRKDQLSDRLLKSSVSKALQFQCLSKVCEELNGYSCLDRNWKRLASHLLKPSPDKSTIERLLRSEDPAYEVLSTWVEKNDEVCFDALLEEMVDCETYSAADELLIYLESVDGNEAGGETSEQNSIEDQPGISETILPVVEKQTTSNRESNSNPMNYRRSRSLMDRFKNFGNILLRRSTSCLETRSNHPIYQPSLAPPKKTEDEIFIVSSSVDHESVPVRNLISFVHTLKPVKVGEWRVTTIHDIPGGPITHCWLTDRVERSAFVIVCFSNNMKQISDHSREDGELFYQAEYNLKFTLEFLINGSLYHNLCHNVNGKFLPILLPGSPYSCIMHSLAYFQVYSWPNDQTKIKKYLMNLPEREMPALGQKKPLVPRTLH